MEITALENKHIKIGETSITVKNPETGKTGAVIFVNSGIYSLTDRLIILGQ